MLAEPHLLHFLVPFAAGPSVGDSQLWGVWNRPQRSWALPPSYGQKAAERLTAALLAPYASAFVKRGPGTPKRCLGLRFRPDSHADGIA